MYDTSNAQEVRILDGPGVGSALLVQDSAAETSLATLAGTVASAKVAVTDAAAETSLATLAGTVSAAKVAVTDASAEASLSTLAATVSGGRIQVAAVAGGATATVSIGFAVASSLIHSGAGTLYAIVVTQSNTAPLIIRDNTAAGAGTIIAVVPANQPVGDLPMYGGGRPYSLGLYCNSGANTPAVTLVYT